MVSSGYFIVSIKGERKDVKYELIKTSDIEEIKPHEREIRIPKSCPNSFFDKSLIFKDL